MIDAIEYRLIVKDDVMEVSRKTESLKKLKGFMGFLITKYNSGAATDREAVLLSYFKDEGTKTKDCLPEGCRVVEVPPFLAQLMGFKEEEIDNVE